MLSFILLGVGGNGYNFSNQMKITDEVKILVVSFMTGV